MQIFVRMPARHTNTLSVHPRNTIEEIKQVLQDQEGVPSEALRLVYGGRQLEDDQSLDDYKIEYESTIYLVLRLRGGKPVTMLCPPNQLDAVVTLKLSPMWRFSAIYPKPRVQDIANPGALRYQQRQGIHKLDF